MKMAKSYKFIILISAFIMSLIFAFSFMSFNTVKADVVPDSDFTGAQTVEYKNDSMVATLKEGDVLKIDNKIIIDDLSIKMSVPSSVAKINVKVTAKSFDPNGNKRVDGEDVFFDKDIVSTFELTQRGDIELKLNVENNFIKFTEVGGSTFVNTDAYYLVENVDKTPATVEFELVDIDNTATTSDTIELSLISVNQKASEGDDSVYNQKFILTDGKLTNARPRAVLDRNFFSSTDTGYVLNKVAGTNYTLTINAYSVVGVPSTVYLTAGNENADGGTGGHSMSFPAETNPKKITFNLKAGSATAVMTFNVSSKISGSEVNLETYTVNVFSINPANYSGTDIPTEISPKYKDASLVETQIDSFQTALTQATIVEEDDGSKHSINLGKTITIPSLECFVTDNITSYNKLSKTYHYVTPSEMEKTTTSSTSITLTHEGKYKLYVTFEDENDNVTESKLFYDVVERNYYVKEDEGFVVYDSSNSDHSKIYTEAEYAIYIFSFNVEDDAPLSVLAEEQDGGFLNVKYTATDFNITASGFTTTYKLFYHSSLKAEAEDDGWKEIINYKKASEDGANGYTYEELKAIAYDGKLSFVPNKLGSYKIECMVTSDNSHRYAFDDTVIRVASEPTTVTPANDWFEDNMVSIIFLGAGTLCLIVILFLLFSKPKNRSEDDD